MRALILAGGQGTRLRPLTASLPKPLVPFCGDAYAHGLLRRLAAIGVDHATFLVGADAAPFAPLVETGPRFGVAVDIATEERPLDTAGAVRRLLAPHEPGGGPVLVLNGDVLTDVDHAELLAAHRERDAVATLHLVEVEDTSAFGVVVRRAEGEVERFVEKPPRGTLDQRTINAGTYVLASDALAGFPGDGPLSFEREVFPGLLDAGRRMLGHVTDAYWQDLGTPDRYVEGHRAVLDGRCRWPLDPAIRVVEGPSLVHDGAEVDASAGLGPYAVVGDGCRIEAGAVVRAAVLHERVVVGAGAQVEGALLAADVRVAPGTVVPRGTVVGRWSAVGGVAGV